MEYLLNDHEDCPKSQKNSQNSQKLYDETGHPAVSLLESLWKLRQQHDQNFAMEGKPL